jgi:hypothetical protein
MKIILKESRLPSFIKEIIKESGRNPYSDKLDAAMNSLVKMLSNDGSRMINIENGKEYLVYYVESLSNALGKNYCISRLIKDGQPYGQIMVKPMDLFKIKN